MKKTDQFPHKIVSLEEAAREAARWRLKGQTIAFTNGVFDILHRGHVFSLAEAGREADKLIVGLNSDASVKRLKGPERPVHDEQARAFVLAALHMVDLVVIFGEDTPITLIETLQPDVLVKGGDYTPEQVVGAPETLARGGRVVINPVLEGYSTTRLIEQLRNR